MSKGAKKIGADEVGDGGGEERCSKLPLVTEAIIMIRISLDRNCHMKNMITSAKDQNLPMVSIICRGREGSSMAMPMLANVIAPGHHDHGNHGQISDELHLMTTHLHRFVCRGRI